MDITDTLRDENLNEITKLTLQADEKKKKQPLGDLWEIFHYQDQPCPRMIIVMGGPGEWLLTVMRISSSDV